MEESFFFTSYLRIFNNLYGRSYENQGYLNTSFFLFILTIKIFLSRRRAVPFLTFPISPSQNAMGYTGTSLPIDDPYGFLLNPAQLGFTSQQNNFSLMVYPSKVKLWGFDNFRIKGLAFNLGYNFKDIIGIPISVGFGFANPELSLYYGKINNNEDWEDKDNYDAYSLGVGIDYYVQFSAGITYKNIDSKISNYGYSQEIAPYTDKANVKAFDFGFLLNIPIIKLFDNNLSFDAFENTKVNPFINFSVGYSQSNIGDEIHYVDPAQSDPLSRAARLGYGISTGADVNFEYNTIRFIGIDFTVDAEDYLIKTKTEYGPGYTITTFDGYQSFIGDIKIGKNILQVKSDNKVTVHSGLQATLLETIIIKTGRIKNTDNVSRKTDGFEIRTKGLLKFLNFITKNTAIDFISNHFDLRYYYSSYSVAEGLETNIKGFAIYFQNLNSLF